MVSLTRWWRRRMVDVAPPFRSALVFAGVPMSARSVELSRRLVGAAISSTSEDERLEVPGADGIARTALLYRPPSGTVRGGVLWIHGGGRVSGVPGLDDIQCRRLADESGVLVLSVDYRLAPEHPFPAGFEDCWASLHWFAHWCLDRGVPDLLAVGGASAGGGLAAEIAQRAADEGVKLVHQLLVYPMLDDRTVERRAQSRGWLVWTPASNRFAWSAYLRHAAGQAEDRPYAVAARRASLAGVASAWVGVGDLDLFFEEDCDYVERLHSAGVHAELVVVPGMYHGADGVPKVRDTPEVRAFHSSMAASLVTALDRAEASPDKTSG